MYTQRLEMTQSSRSGLGPKMKPILIFLALVITTGTSWSANESAAQDQIWRAFSPVDSIVDAELQDWLEDTYLPNLESREYHLRSRFAEVDSSELDRRFRMSFDDIDRFERHSSWRYGHIYPEVLEVSESDILVEMFPGTAYRIAVVRHATGRSNGMSMVHVWVLENGFTGRERVYFEIKRDGEIIGIFLANPRMYRVSSTPKEGVVVISEFDYEGVRKSRPVRFD